MTALVTGAIVMALEILGSRLLAPVFGNSLFVWGALIGVILAAMSSGYAFGGWASDRYRVAAVLAWLLLRVGCLDVTDVLDGPTGTLPGCQSRSGSAVGA